MHHTTSDFWQQYHLLPKFVQRNADRCYALMRDNPSHPSLRMKRVGEQLELLRIDDAGAAVGAAHAVLLRGAGLVGVAGAGLTAAGALAVTVAGLDLVLDFLDDFIETVDYLLLQLLSFRSAA